MNEILQTISSIGIVPVIAIDDANKAVPLAKALADGGLPAAEVTFRTAAAEDAIRAIAKEAVKTMLGFSLRHVGINCGGIAKAANVAKVFSAISGLSYKKGMTDLCQYVDMCISNEEDAEDVFGIEAKSTDIYAGEINREGYKSVPKQLADKFGLEKVAITLRESHSAFLTTSGPPCYTTWATVSKLKLMPDSAGSAGWSRV